MLFASGHKITVYQSRGYNYMPSLFIQSADKAVYLYVSIVPLRERCLD